MHGDYWRFEATRCNGLLNPQDDSVAGAPDVVTQIVVQTNFLDGSGFEESNGLFGPVDAVPPFWRLPLIVEEHLHDCFH